MRRPDVDGQQMTPELTGIVGVAHVQSAAGRIKQCWGVHRHPHTQVGYRVCVYGAEDKTGGNAGVIEVVKAASVSSRCVA